MKRKILLIFLDLLLVAIAFLIVAWYKPATISLVIPFYFNSFLLFIGIWLFISLITKKYNFFTQKIFRDSIITILIANFTVAAVSSILIYIFNLYYYSRLIVFGTIIISTFFEFFLFYLFHIIRTSVKIEESEFPITGGNIEDVNLKASTRRKLKESIVLENGKGKNIPENIKKLIVDESGKRVYDFVKKHLSGSDKRFIVVSTTTRFNLFSLPFEKYDFIVNLKKTNDFQRINKFFEAVNGKLSDNGLYAGKVETYVLRKERILKKSFYPLNYLLYTIDFIFKRFFPKVPILKNFYFAITHGNNRVLSKAETLGRLYSCGFEVIDESFIEGYFCFVMKKTGEPNFPKNPTYGPMVRLNRIGKEGREFYVFKMRTMFAYSEYLQNYVFEKNALQEGGKFKDDFRVTTIGKIMRTFWIDEMPMFINLFRRNMKIVGVRPLSKHYFSLYSDELKQKRIKYKPGLVPPFYADMPKTLDEIMDSEMKYLEEYEKHPFRTDLKYFFKAWNNILFKHARSN